MELSAISLDSQIRLRPLSKQLENGVAIIGWGDEFLELPPEGLHFIAWLNEGLSLREARQRFETHYNPFPEDEVWEVVKAFWESDFIAAVDGQAVPPQPGPLSTQALWLPRAWTGALFSKPVLLAWMGVVIPAAILWIRTPALWPRLTDYFWVDYNFIIILVGLLLWLVDMALHELAHLLACRAKGIDASITWTQRLGFIPMSQTVMHNIWAVPGSARLLPLAAGMVWDVGRISLLVYLLFFQRLGWLVWPELVTKFLKFYLLTSTLSLTAQFWLFSKMDGYFLLSALLGQRNLQADTYAWFKSRLSKMGHFDPPTRGMKFIYLYALVTILGGGLFMGQFFLVQLPIKLRLLWEAFLRISGSAALAPLEFGDGVAVLTSQVIDLGLLMYAYWRETWPSWRQS
ncbi:MAG: hypothetical protein KJ077_47960 [Anaerolineae bacterium]|nr:hypothetical protein [Anaerolineae bacterium]